MKKIILSLFCLYTFVVAKVDMNKPVSFEESLKISADVMNKSLPIMVDSELRHDKVETKETTMTFKFTLVHFTKEEMDADKLKALMEADIKEGICSDEDSRIMLQRGMKVVYDYSDKNKKHIARFDYDAKACGLTINLAMMKENM